MTHPQVNMTKIVAMGLLSLLSCAGLVHSSPLAMDKRGHHGPRRAVYFATNDATENAIVALKVNSDGTLSDGSITATGGMGGGAFGTDGAPFSPDPLFSQDSVSVSGNVSL